MKQDFNLSDFLYPLQPQDFFIRLWEKDFFVFENKLKVPFGISDFEDLINFGNLSYPQIRCYDSTSIIPSLNYTQSTINSVSSLIDPARLANLIYENKTVRIADLPKIHSDVFNFSSKISNIFDCEVNVNAYFSRGPCLGLSGHYDPHHVFAFQLHGEKTWNLGDIIIEKPAKQYAPKPLSTPSVKTKLVTKPGQMLYLPPGMWHSTETESTSLHITIGVHPPKWSFILENLLKKMFIRHSIVRSSIPMSVNSDKCAYNEPSTSEILALIKVFQLDIESSFVYSQVNEQKRKQSLTLPRQPSRLIDDEMITVFKSEKVKDLISNIWKLSNFPYSMYFRGSFLKKDNIFSPWDLDIYLIVDNLEESLGDIAEISRKLSDSYPSLPRIDLTLLSKYDLLFGEEQVLRRLLLIYDGSLVKGNKLKSQITPPALNSDTALSIMQVMFPFVDAKILHLKALIETNSYDSSEDLDIQTKSVAKAVLRAGVFIGIRSKSVFSRDILICYQHIVDEFPYLDSLAKLMLQRIQGQEVDLWDFIKAAEELKQRLYCEL